MTLKMALVLSACLYLAITNAQTTPAVPANDLWARIQQLMSDPAPKREVRDGAPVFSREYLEADARYRLAIATPLLEFIEQYPEAARAWSAAILLNNHEPLFFAEIGDVAGGSGNHRRRNGESSQAPGHH